MLLMIKFRSAERTRAENPVAAKRNIYSAAFSLWIRMHSALICQNRFCCREGKIALQHLAIFSFCWQWHAGNPDMLHLWQGLWRSVPPATRSCSWTKGLMRAAIAQCWMLTLVPKLATDFNVFPHQFIPMLRRQCSYEQCSL